MLPLEGGTAGLPKGGWVLQGWALNGVTPWGGSGSNEVTPWGGWTSDEVTP